MKRKDLNKRLRELREESFNNKVELFKEMLLEDIQLRCSPRFEETPLDKRRCTANIFPPGC